MQTWLSWPSSAMCLSTFVTDRSQLRNSLTTSVSLLCWIPSNCCSVHPSFSCFGLQYFQSRPIWLLPKNGCAQHTVSCIFVSLTYFYFKYPPQPFIPDPCDHTWVCKEALSFPNPLDCVPKAFPYFCYPMPAVRNIDHRVIWLGLHFCSVGIIWLDALLSMQCFRSVTEMH